MIVSQDMFDLNKKVAPQENLVGWFATGGFLIYQRSIEHQMSILIYRKIIKIKQFGARL